MCFAVIGLKLAQRRLSSSLKNHPEATLRKKENYAGSESHSPH
jgi:hypothetical protein